MWKRTYLLNITLLFAVSLFLVPKIILIEFFSYRWIDTGARSVFLFLLQDLILSAIVYLVAMAAIKKNKLYFYVLSIFSGVLLLCLLLDMRVRELWLKPLDLPLVKYSLQNASDLASGVEIFLNQSSGFGFTFRFIVFVLFLAYLATWLLVGLAAYKIHGSKSAGKERKSKYGAMFILLLSAMFLWSAYTGDARYDLNKNIFINPLVATVRNTISLGAVQDEALLEFEQPTYPLSAINHIQRLDPQPTPEFKNLVYVVLESVRWNSIFGAGVKTAEKYPVFEKLAREGMLFKSYVSVPHSSKGYYSILTGLHAYPDIEIKEAMRLYQPSIIHELKKKKNMEAVAFSSLFLQFENMGGFLRSIGVSNAYEASDMALGKIQPQNNSSFGESDEYLFSASVSHLEDIAKEGKGFIALYFPTAAHYPYNCTSDPASQVAIKKYEECIMKIDALIGGMLDAFDKSGILDSTLFVLVGDHGESFGEHGTFIHNSSMHEEEVTVPLIFWAKGKVLPRNTSTTSQQIDIAPTIADFFGVTDSSLNVQGVSLLREQGRRVFFMSTFFNELASALVDHPYKYIYEYGPGTIAKYNIVDDPQEKSPQPVLGSEFNAIKNRLLSYDLYQKTIFAKKPEPTE
ncbi:LTA synthase family protein [Pseudomonas akapageensis]|uniref:LTA synthase family protein n=1 Tax=Pseudomonas akapageensis TaxID=2609961 RepID=UPI00140A3418|nr:sulfatase-like hydrolase/transferase [Pseudomonas akapageensis]